jgi:hypothetical protein
MALALRPSFAIDLAMPTRKALPRLTAELASGPMALRRTRVPGSGRDDDGPRDRDHLVLTVPAAARHFWSPWLTIDVAPHDGGAHLFARFSPHPSVWTAFVLGYLALGSITAVALAIAGSGLMVRGVDLSWALWGASACAIGMAAMWWVSQLGQRIARAQMVALAGELDRAIDAIGAGRVASADRSLARSAGAAPTRN